MAPSQSAVIAILQARMSSSRLPGKVLKPLLGKPMIKRQIERTLRARRIDRLIVATSDDPSDDILASLCDYLGIVVFRGSLTDVLDRYFKAAKSFGAAHIVRLTADCPLTDPELIDCLIEFYLEGGYNYASNAIIRTLPKGLDAEVFSCEALETAWTEAVLPSHREHVTPYILSNLEKFRLGTFQQEPDLSALRWTVDYPDDLIFVREVYDALYPANPEFTTTDILNLLNDRPELVAINNHFDADETVKKSRKQDANFLVPSGGET